LCTMPACLCIDTILQAMQPSMYALMRWWMGRKKELKNNLKQTLELFSKSAHESWLTFGSDLDGAAEKLLRRAAPPAGASSRAEKANVDATNDVLIIDDSAAAAVGAAVGGASAARETSSRVGEDAGPSAGGGSSSGRGKGRGRGRGRVYCSGDIFTCNLTTGCSKCCCV
jgi:hypothetical protein